MKLYPVEAVVLHQKPMRGADKIIIMFTREYGKLRAVAHGAGKSSSRKRGAVQPLCHSRLLLYRGKEIDTVNQCEAITFFTRLRDHLEILALAVYICELVDALTGEGDQNEPLFILLLTTLGWLNQPQVDLPGAERLVAGFEIKALGLTGYLPELNVCVNCGGDITGHTLFSAHEGGVICPKCIGEGYRPMGTVVKPQTVELLRQLIATNPGGLTKLTPQEAVFNQVKKLNKALLRHNLEKKAKSLDFLESLHKNPRNWGKY
ncbi:DNA repair protein RecO [Desulfofalx alkaliphila]|uniref:DNA repair protein RecO n=1 Tax=Desulfofalx alkaliphila TaxID=105483 RepID=UPI000557F7A4|nr:DNA repair protein RecO [Desulfofalx alkaliphila]